LWNVVETPEFKKDIQQPLLDYPRLTDAIDGIKSALSCNPTARPMVFVDYGIRSISIGTWPGVPAAHIYYQVAKEEVRLLYMQLAVDES